MKIEKRNGEVFKDAIYLTFKYSPKTIEKVKSFKRYHYHADTKEWELPAEYENKVREVFAEELSIYDINEPINLPPIKVTQKLGEIPPDFKFKVPPFEHQKVAIQYAQTHDKFLLGDEMGTGKALALNTKVYTPDGYKEMRDIEVGDYVFGKDGKPTKVLNTYVVENANMYRLHFVDNTFVDCCEDHLWQIESRHGTSVVDTKWLAGKDFFGNPRLQNFKGKNGMYKYWISYCEPVEFSHKETKIEPYILGVILASGVIRNRSIKISNNKNDILKTMKTNPDLKISINKKGMATISWKKNSDFDKNLKEINVSASPKDRRIPEEYLYNDVESRYELARGICDIKASVNKRKVIKISSKSLGFLEDFKILIESFGGTCARLGFNKHQLKEEGLNHLIVKVKDPSLLMTLEHKVERTSKQVNNPKRAIVKIEKIENQTAKCITVENEDGLYLIEHFIVTHNTKTSIDISCNKNIKHCLIVCGINGIKWNWKNEIEKFSNEKCRFLGQKVSKKTGKITIGTAKDKLKDVLSIPGAEEFYFITNVESLRDKNISEELAKMCRLGEIGMVIVDEMHKCTNSESKQTQGLLRLEPRYKLAMTGTPLMNKPLDLYTILYWLGVEKGNYWQFKSKYCVMEERKTSSGHRFKDIVGYKNLVELQTKLANLMLRRTKEEVLDLPEKVMVDEYVEMEKNQQELYENELTEVIPQIKESKDVANALRRMMRLRQVTSCPSSINPKVECAKLDRMEQIVEECVLNDKSVIIFSNWTTVTDEIVKRLNKYNPALVTGKVKETDRAEAIDKFQAGKTKVIIGTIGAMGTGLNLTKATVEIFVDEPWTEAVKSQCEDRAHRIGQKNNITIYNLITKDTIDEQIHSLLKSKKDLSLALVDNASIERFVLGQL